MDASRLAGQGGESTQMAAAGGKGRPTPIQFYRAVVEIIIHDIETWDWEGPEGATEEEGDRYQDMLEKPAARFECPDNTLLVRVVSMGEYKNTGKLKICHPMFPSHLQMPVKVGEQIFMFIDGEVGYWIARAPGTLSVDDANYSHADRKFVDVINLDSVVDESANSEGEGELPIGRFNNGGIEGDLTTFAAGDDYTAMWDESLSKFNNVYEPVPKFIKRPGDLVLQGSNNSLIVLGTHRGWHKEKPSDWKEDFIGDSTEVLSNSYLLNNEDNAENDNLKGQGSIDMVVGRGRYPPLTETTAKSEGDDPIRTACRTLANEREFIEADRAPSMRFLEPNRCEGDPDFGYDAGRILLTQKSNSDYYFGFPGDDADKLPSVTAWSDGKSASNNVDVGTGQNDDDESYDPDKGESGGRGDGAVPIAVADSSYVVMKSDEVRIIARQQEKDEQGLPDAPDINGSIKFIKEGVEDAEDGTGRAVIMMMPDGTIMIDGPTVIIGSGGSGLEKDHGKGTQVVLGRGATEPLVLGQALKNILDQHMNDMKDMVQDLKDHVANVFDTHTHPTGVGPSGPPLVPGAATDAALSQRDAAFDATITDLVTILSKYGKTK